MRIASAVGAGAADVGLNQRSSVLGRMGLGGYYVIIDVENTINEEGFETTFSALNQGTFMYGVEC